MSIIQLLPDYVANQIAAGEVVQRPASVVKELLENAVDAKATDIKLIVKDAGKTLIQVVDNGLGMSVTDARLCFDRHATSKIRHAEDLFSLVTKGFRGEALASIAAIAHVELKTKQEQDELGTVVAIEGSVFVSQDVAVLPKGTSFSVKNLFYNVPARRHFLKSDAVEWRTIIDEFQRVVLAHPSLSFVMYHNGHESFHLPSSNYRQRIVALFGGKTNEKLVPIQETTDMLAIQGFVGKPEFAKKSRGEQFFFVNDRYIKSSYLHHAIMSAFEGLLKDGLQPSYFIYLTVPPHTIDINIHPTKTEIKFEDEQALYAILRAAVKHGLGQFNVAPILDFERDSNLDTPYNYQKKEATFPIIQVDSNFNPFSKEEQVSSKKYTSDRRIGHTAHWEGLYSGLKQATQDVFIAKSDAGIPSDALEALNTIPVLEYGIEVPFESEEVTGFLFNDKDIQDIEHKTYQIHKKYIVSSIKSGMVIIDQQRAHQRVLYEQFLTNMTVAKTNSQQLLFPISLSFSRLEMQLIFELKESLQNMGFVFESVVSDEVLVISGLPLRMTQNDVLVLLEQLLSDLQQGENSFSQNDSIAKSMAKTLSVKTGTFLNIKEQENLVNSLFACKEPHISPFQKNTFITMSVEDLDKKFI